MEAISVQCQMCQHSMKFSAEKAGKRAKCPKCDAVVTIVALPQEKEAPKPAEGSSFDAPPDPSQPSAPPPATEEDDGKGTYEVVVDPELALRQKELLAEQDKKKKKEKKKLPKVTRKVKALADGDKWEKVRLGMFFVAIGSILWILSHVLQGSYVLLGATELSEYAETIATFLEKRRGEEDLPPVGQFWHVDELGIYLRMIAGRDFAGFAYAALILSSLLSFFQSIVWGLSYFLLLPVPRRYGMFGQALTMLALAGFNFLFLFMLRLLPVLGIHGYILIPYVTPEIVLTEYNMERTVPIHVLWSSAPFWENMLNLFLRFGQYLEPTMMCIFVWSTGLCIKEDEVIARGKGMAQFCMGTLFVFMCFNLLSLCGASPVLVNLLRLIYLLWFGFYATFILSFYATLMRCRVVLEEKIHPTNELIEKKDKKAKRDWVDKDEDEDEETDEDEEDD